MLWTAGDASIGSNTLVGVSGTVSGISATVSSGQTLGVFTNNGTVQAQLNGFFADSSQNLGTLINIGTISGGSNDILNQGTIGALTNSGHVGTVGSGLPLNGIYNNGGYIGVLENTGTGTIFSQRTAINNAAGSTIGTLNNAGSLIGQGTGGIVQADGINNGGQIGTITNSGVISGNINNTQLAGYGIYNSGTIGTLSNQGVIQSNTSSSGIGLYNTAGGLITLLSNSTLGSIQGLVKGLSNAGNIGTIINAGSISGASSGIDNTGSIGTLSNSGHITGAFGVHNNISAQITTLSNGSTGTIFSANTGIANGNVIGTLSNAGLIHGDRAGINNSFTSSGHQSNIGVLSNSGSITGAVAIYNQGTIGTLINSKLIVGNTTGIYNLATAGTIGTLVNSGTISGGQYAININSGAILGGVANSGTIIGNFEDLDSHALTISGGSGSTFGTLTGNSGVLGSIVAASDLVFSSGNQLLNDNVSVNSGNGTMMLAGGVLQVNNQVNIDGNYHQVAGSTLAVGLSSSAGTLGVSADSGYGRLVVSGNATIESGSSVVFKKLTTFNYAVGQRFVVVQAAGTGDYNAGNLIYTGTGYTAGGSQVLETINSTVYSDLVVTITGVSNGGAPTNGSVATNGNANAVLNGLFNYAGLDQSLLNVYNPAIAITDSGEANKAGAQLSPAATGAALSQSVQVSTQAVIDVTTAHIDAVRVAQASGSNSGSSGIATGEGPSDAAVWGQAFYGQANQSDRTGAAGYKAGYNGALVGVDTAVGDQWRAGGLFSYSNTSMANTGDNTGSSGHATSYGLTGYAGYAGDAWYLDLLAGVAAQKYNTLRAVNFTGFSGSASGSFDGMQYIASAQAGYPIKLDTATTLTPIGGLTYGRLHQDGYTETGSAALQIGSSSTTSIKSDLGAKLERVFKTSYGDLTPSAQLSWRHEYRDTGLRSVASFAADTTGATSFVSQGVAPEKDTGVLVLGLTLARSRNLTLSGHYTLEAAGGYTAQTADVRLRYQF